MAFTSVTKATTFISGGWDAFNNLISDILSTASGKGASQVGVEDSAGYFSSSNVEDVLAELRDDTSTTVTLAETFAEDSSTTTSLTWGFKGGLFRLDNIVTNVSSGTIGLTDDSTNYVEINPATGLMTKNTTAFTSGRIPIREIITASGSQTTSTDKRAWFSQVAAGTLTIAGINNLATVGSIKTDNYTVTTADTETQIILGSATASDKIFTLTSVGSDEDGMVVHFYNASDYKLTIQPSDTDSVWNSGAGYGIETIQPGSYCTLRYEHSTTSWQALQIGGGLWTVEGLKLHIPMTELTLIDVDSSAVNAATTDKAKMHFPVITGGIKLNASDGAYSADFDFNGADEKISINDSTDWDFMSSLTDDWCIIIRPKHDAVGSNEWYFSEAEDGSNYYRFGKNATNELAFSYVTSLGTNISLTADTALSAVTRYTIMLAKIAGEIGLYYGTGNTLSQDAYSNTVWTVDSFAAALDVGVYGAQWFKGLANDAVVINQNIFNAAPNVGKTDTVTVQTNLNFSTGGY